MLTILPALMPTVHGSEDRLRPNRDRCSMRSTPATTSLPRFVEPLHPRFRRPDRLAARDEREAGPDRRNRRRRRLAEERAFPRGVLDRWSRSGRRPRGQMDTDDAVAILEDAKKEQHAVRAPWTRRRAAIEEALTYPRIPPAADSSDLLAVPNIGRRQVIVISAVGRAGHVSGKVRGQPTITGRPSKLRSSLPAAEADQPGLLDEHTLIPSNDQKSRERVRNMR